MVPKHIAKSYRFTQRLMNNEVATIIRELERISTHDLETRLAFNDVLGYYKSNRGCMQYKSYLHKTGVTRKRLWQEYMAAHEDGYQYSQYCNLLRKYLKDTDPTFHWEYNPAEIIQADFAGDKLSYVDKETGEVISVEVFVATLPFSGLIFCMAVASQRMADFVICINNMLKYFGGVSLTILLDNFKTAVKKADRYEPDFTRLSLQLSEHYNTTFSATRPSSPRDKGMVEGTVRIVYQQIYAAMRHQTFYSQESLNYEIRHHLDVLNNKPYKSSQESRRSLFESREKPFLKPLPETPFN